MISSYYTIRIFLSLCYPTLYIWRKKYEPYPFLIAYSSFFFSKIAIILTLICHKTSNYTKKRSYSYNIYPSFYIHSPLDSLLTEDGNAKRKSEYAFGIEKRCLSKAKPSI